MVEKYIPLSAIVQYLEESAEGIYGTPEFANLYTSLSKTFIDNAESLGAVAFWTPITEGMPDPYEEVALTVEYINGKRSVMDTVRFNPDLMVWEWPYEAGADYWEDVPERYKPIAWMRIPGPYQGE